MASQRFSLAKLRLECFLKKKRGVAGEYVHDLSEEILLGKWKEFLVMQIKVAASRDVDHKTAGKEESAVLIDMRAMCPATAASFEDIERACQDTPFYTPMWKGRTPAMTIPPRELAPVEVDVINRTYLELHAAFLE